MISLYPIALDWQPNILVLTFTIVAIIITFVIINFNSKSKKSSDVIEEIDALEIELEDNDDEMKIIYSSVESNYNKKNETITLNPDSYGHLYEHLDNPIEVTEVMVLEYLTKLRKDDNDYDYSWKYKGLNQNNECVYSVCKKKVRPFTGNYKDYNNKIDNLITVVNYFMETHKNVSYSFEDVFSDNWIQFGSPCGKKYIVEFPCNEDSNIKSKALERYGNYYVSEEDVFRKDITDNPKGGVLFMLDAFFEIYELNRVRLHFKTLMEDELYDCQYDLDDLIFAFDIYVYQNNFRDKLLTTEKQNKKRSRRITQKVKDDVWRRDEGKCVECGSNENLEFDHIIPFSKGGANTYRNIQLLCESCNRSKSAKIG